MSRSRLTQRLALTLTVLRSAQVLAAAEPEFQPIFDGRTLDGWETPEPGYWRIEEGAITGEITPTRPCTVNQYLVWKGGELADFELKLRSRLRGEGGINNGFQFRSRVLPDHDVCGYQVDNNLQTPWLVRLYDEFGRHTLAWRGERTVIDAAGGRATTPLAEAGTPAWFRLEDWHEYHLVCVGPRLTLHVDGRLAAEVVDGDTRRFEAQGALALQLHSGPPTLVQFKDVRIKVLKPAVPAPPARDAALDPQARLRGEALAWWDLDVGGHGARPPLKHIPGWEQFELNVRPAGPWARSGRKVVLLDGAYFDAGPALHGGREAVTVHLRARDPSGAWNAGLMGKRGSLEQLHLNLFSTDFPGTPGPDIGFEIRTDRGLAQVSFPVSAIPADAWHDLVARYDGRSMALFCDGRRLAGREWSGTLQENQEPWLIGAETDQSRVVRHFRGELESAAIWSRALTDEEIVLLGTPSAVGVE
jgi:hypothetical protein